MPTLLDRLRSAHRFLAQHSFYPLVLSSALACGILAARAYLSHSPTYIFLVWILFLAWVPYYWSLWAASDPAPPPGPLVAADRARRAVAAVLPNAPYIVTDFVHLRARAPIPLWFDIGLIAIFAWSGCFLAVASLRIMQALVGATRRRGELAVRRRHCRAERAGHLPGALPALE